MSKTVVGLFSTIAQAEQVKQSLLADGYQSSQIKIVANDETGSTGTTTTTSATANDSSYTDIGSGGGTGIGEKISSFFRSLSGGDDDAHQHYTSGVSQGGALLAVTCDDVEATEIAATLKQHGARDIDGGYQAAAGSGTPVYGSSTTDVTGQTAIPIIEEELVVGKREVDRGGVRVYSHVVETPVATDVTLREEQINVQRRAVDRPATSADFAAGADSMIELTATGEEAVVGKTSRVVEEVLVGKQGSERTESIQDSVRRTEVEVEKIPAETVVKQTY